MGLLTLRILVAIALASYSCRSLEINGLSRAWAQVDVGGEVESFEPSGWIPSEEEFELDQAIPQLSASQIPANFSWHDVDGKNYLTFIRNQNIPLWCGSCWAQASTSSLSDRIKIMRNASFPDIVISVQAIVTCSPWDRGCNGGNALNVYKWIKANNITDESCSIYQAKDTKRGLVCDDQTLCQVCYAGEGCKPQPNAKIYGISSYGVVAGEDAMIQEIYQRGPYNSTHIIRISCLMAITDEWRNYTGGIYEDKTGRMVNDHYVSVIGWGVTQEGIKYWVARNSGGTYWGEKGLFRIIRGTNNLNIEHACRYRSSNNKFSWAVPRDTWTNDDRNQTLPITTRTLNKDQWWSQLFKKPSCFKPNQQQHYTPLIKNELPHRIMNASDVPNEWHWGNVDGVNFLSVIRNQHVPNSCGACWVFGPLSSLADRINIRRNNTFPDMLLSAQAVINCKAGGSCHGGNPLGVYAFAYVNGIPEESCQIYEGKDPEQFECSDMQQCQNCRHSDKVCYAVPSYPKWYVSEYGNVQGVENMKAEIYLRGPISCGMLMTDGFKAYQGGIFEEDIVFPQLNCVVSVVGWGIDELSGVEFWYVRHSWGSYWGEDGFFRMRMHKNNLGLETDCSWGVPQLSY